MESHSVRFVNLPRRSAHVFARFNHPLRISELFYLNSENKKRMFGMEHPLLESGGDLLSRAVSSQVPSALKGLTSVFGMGTGGTPSPLPPEIASFFKVHTLTTAHREEKISVRSTVFRLSLEIKPSTD